MDEYGNMHEMISDYHIAYDAAKAKEAREAAGKKALAKDEDEPWEPQGTPKAKTKRGTGTPSSTKTNPKSPPPGTSLMTSHFVKSPTGRPARKREQSNQSRSRVPA